MRTSNRSGFALPLAIMVIAILTAAVAAGFAATASEAVVNNAQRAQERAYQIAEAGLQQFLVRRAESGFCTGCSADPTVADSEYTRVQLNGGYADIVARSVRKENGYKPAIYFIRSRGVDTAARLGGAGSTTFAERTVGVYAKWNTTTMQALGALTTFNGVTRTGGTIDQNNVCGASSTYPDLPTDVMSIALGGNSISGFTTSVDSSAIIDSLNAWQAVDWDGIINQNQLPADVTIPPAAWPTSYPPTYWPISRIKTSAAAVMPLSVVGQGIIIADSDFTLPRTPDWKGIILIGGKLITTSTGGGNSIVQGAVVTGLNRLFTGSAPTGVTSDNDLVSSNHTIRYASCYMQDAGARLHGYSLMPNTWMDNVAAW